MPLDWRASGTLSGVSNGIGDICIYVYIYVCVCVVLETSL